MTKEQLRITRKWLGLTQAQLAQQLGVARESVWHWERGSRKVPSLLDVAMAEITRRAKA